MLQIYVDSLEFNKIYFFKTTVFLRNYYCKHVFESYTSTFPYKSNYKSFAGTPLFTIFAQGPLLHTIFYQGTLLHTIFAQGQIHRYTNPNDHKTVTQLSAGARENRPRGR